MKRTREGGIEPGRAVRWAANVRIGLVCSVLAVLGLLSAPTWGAPPRGKQNTQRMKLSGPANAPEKFGNVVQVLDSRRNLRGYYMDVDSVVCADATCDVVTVRLHFDALGAYERYELPSGGNLTKAGDKPFSAADHQRLHQLLSDPHSAMKSVAWDQITVPTTADAGARLDGLSGATVLSKQNLVVAGAAYTCCTLWHWSHDEVVDVIRDMTSQASDQQDLLRYLKSEESGMLCSPRTSCWCASHLTPRPLRPCCMSCGRAKTSWRPRFCTSSPRRLGSPVKITS